MSSASFGGTLIVESSEGGFRYTPGVVSTDVRIGKPARGRRRWVKDLGTAGASHGLEVVYDVPTGSLSSVLSRLASIATGRIGSLILTGFPTVNRCVVAGSPALSTIKRTKTGYYFVAQITFEEL